MEVEDRVQENTVISTISVPPWTASSKLWTAGRDSGTSTSKTGACTPAPGLFHLRQGTRRAREFALDFRTLAAGAGWNDRAPIDHYRCSLHEDVC
jgi:hypothetical protein